MAQQSAIAQQSAARVFKAVIWDQGNVLDSHRESDRQIAAALGLDFADFQRYASRHIRAAHLGLDEVKFFNRVLKDAGRPATAEPMLREIWGKYRPVNERMLYVNQQVRAQGYKTAILSNAETVLRDMMQERYGVPGENCTDFDAIVCSCEEGYAKPDREIYEKVCGLLGIAPSEGILVDDSAKNVKGFRDMGGYAILHVDDVSTAKELSGLLGCSLTLGP